MGASLRVGVGLLARLQADPGKATHSVDSLGLVAMLFERHAEPLARADNLVCSRRPALPARPKLGAGAPLIAAGNAAVLDPSGDCVLFAQIGFCRLAHDLRRG